MKKVNPVEIQKSLAGIDYPANKQDLLSYAREREVHERIMKILEQLPEDIEINTAIDLNKAIGQVK